MRKHRAEDIRVWCPGLRARAIELLMTRSMPNAACIHRRTLAFTITLSTASSHTDQKAALRLLVTGAPSSASSTSPTEISDVRHHLLSTYRCRRKLKHSWRLLLKCSSRAALFWGKARRRCVRTDSRSIPVSRAEQHKVVLHRTRQSFSPAAAVSEADAIWLLYSRMQRLCVLFIRVARRLSREGGEAWEAEKKVAPRKHED